MEVGWTPASCACTSIHVTDPPASYRVLSPANISSYSHYVFSALDQSDSGVITFEVISASLIVPPSALSSSVPWRLCFAYFQDFALGLSVLLNGTLDEKLRLVIFFLHFPFYFMLDFFLLRWTFNLYDLNGDGVITRDEMENVTASVKAESY